VGEEQHRTFTLQNLDVVSYKDVRILGVFVHAILQRYLEETIIADSNDGFVWIQLHVRDQDTGTLALANYRYHSR
jgi:hypothetical protein